MFTGIVTAIGTVETAEHGRAGLTLRVRSPWTDLAVGESIAVDGACLTVESLGRGSFTVHVIATSLERTLFADYRAERRVNLERALAVGAPPAPRHRPLPGAPPLRRLARRARGHPRARAPRRRPPRRPHGLGARRRGG